MAMVSKKLQDLDRQVEKPETEDEEVEGAWAYMFGRKVDLAMIARIPSYLMMPFLIMRLQSALCALTFGPDDPDLAEEFEKWFCILSIGLDGQGRADGLGIAAAEMRDQEEASEKAALWGKMKG